MGSLLSVVAPHYKTIAVVASTALVGGAHFLPGLKNSSSALVDFSHLGSFSTWFGIQFWVTAVAGLTMVKILPRNWFAKVQRVLFDHYFLSGFVLNSVMLSSFLIKHPAATWEGETSTMGKVLAASTVSVAIHSFYIKPWVSNTSKTMQDFEGDRGYGNEPGPIKEASILNDPKYIEIKKKFVKAHSISASLNLVNIGFSFYHLWYIGNHITF